MFVIRSVVSYLESVCKIINGFPMSEKTKKQGTQTHAPLDLYIRRNIHLTYYLNPIGIERYCLKLGSPGIVGTFLWAEIMLLRRDVCVNASTRMLSF